MEVPLLLQFSIALFTGMVASTFIPPVRRTIPPPVEILMWVGLVTVCVIGVVSITDPQARELTASVAWAAEQLVNTMVGLVGAGAVGWISYHRFTIAALVLLVAAADLLALAAIRSLRRSQRLGPQVRLRDWMVLPRLGAEPAPVRSPYGTVVADLNHNVTAGLAFVVAGMVTAALSFAIWARDEFLPRGARRVTQMAAVGRVQSRARLEALRDATAQVQFAARAWYVAAAAPAVNGLSTKAAQAVRTATTAVGDGAWAAQSGQVVDIRVLLGAQPIGWYGPLTSGPSISVEGEGDVAEQQPDRLAS